MSNICSNKFCESHQFMWSRPDAIIKLIGTSSLYGYKTLHLHSPPHPPQVNCAIAMENFVCIFIFFSSHRCWLACSFLKMPMYNFLCYEMKNYGTFYSSLSSFSFIGCQLPSRQRARTREVFLVNPIYWR